MTKYQLISDPGIIVEAIQFDPHKHPWPDGVIPHPKDCQPKDMTWGYVNTPDGQVHVMAGDYIVNHYPGEKGRKYAYSRELFEQAYRPVIVLVAATIEQRQIGNLEQVQTIVEAYDGSRYFDEWATQYLQEHPSQYDLGEALKYINPVKSNPRDTQFQGFAKALWEEMEAIKCEGLFTGEHVLNVHRKQREAIARRAYDLAEHTIEQMKPYIYGEQVAGQESVSDVPDMPELPKE